MKSVSAKVENMSLVVIAIKMTSNRDGITECSRYKFKEWGVMNFCGECEHCPAEGRYCHYVYEGDIHGVELAPTFGNSPACAVFSEKKRTPFEEKRRTCGECYLGYWRKNGQAQGVCTVNAIFSAFETITTYRKACDNFKGEA